MAAASVQIPQKIGEVISATSTSFVSQAYKLYGAPPLGGLVQAGEPATFGVVCQVRTEPFDPSRPVLARGETAADEDEVYRDNPQISRLLTTRFDALVVGYLEGGNCFHRLPPLPPIVHSFVRSCLPDQVRIFAESLGFLHLLARDGALATDEVIGSCVQWVSAALPDSHGFLLKAGRVLAGDFSGDLPRINAILRRIAS